MTIAVNDLVDEIELLSNDSSNDRTSAATIIKFISMAQRDIVIRSHNLGLRSAYRRTKVIQLQAGPTQSMTSCYYSDDSTWKTVDDCLSLIRINRNVGRTWVTGTAYAVGDTVYADPADSTNRSTRYECIVAHTAGTFSSDLSSAFWRTSTDLSGPPVEEIVREILEMIVVNPYHVDDSTNSEISHWYLRETQNEFGVYPGQPRAESTTAAFQFVEAVYTAIPDDVSAGGNIVLADIYKDAIIDYCLYRIYSQDDDLIGAGQQGRSAEYWRIYKNNEIFNLR